MWIKDEEYYEMKSYIYIGLALSSFLFCICFLILGNEFVSGIFVFPSILYSLKVLKSEKERKKEVEDKWR